MNTAPAIPYEPNDWHCKMCPAEGMCHKGEPTKEVNCRTCAHSTAREDSTWYCERWAHVIPYDPDNGVLTPLEGCKSHVLHPDMVPWDMESIGEQWHVAWVKNDVGVKSTVGMINGNPDELPGAKTSEEILRDE